MFLNFVSGSNETLKKWVCESLRTSLLCIMGEFAGGGSVAVAVGVSDM